MKSDDLIMLLSHYPDCEVLGPGHAGESLPISAIEFNPENESVTLQVSKPRKVGKPWSWHLAGHYASLSDQDFAEVGEKVKEPEEAK
jgi:hypothetical protein